MCPIQANLTDINVTECCPNMLTRFTFKDVNLIDAFLRCQVLVLSAAHGLTQAIMLAVNCNDIIISSINC